MDYYSRISTGLLDRCVKSSTYRSSASLGFGCDFNDLAYWNCDSLELAKTARKRAELEGQKHLGGADHAGSWRLFGCKTLPGAVRNCRGVPNSGRGRASVLQPPTIFPN